jgi:hypothetical protein
MRTFTSASDKLASQRLLKACEVIIDQYRKEVGHLPGWLGGLGAADALNLLAASTRVGMKLPWFETLAGDHREQDHESSRAYKRGSRKRP